MICLVLTGKTLDEDLRIIEENRAFIEMAELRADYLDPGESGDIVKFPARAGLPLILTVRKEADGGFWQGSEEERLALLAAAAAGDFSYVDLEEKLPPQPWEEEFMKSGGRVIRSFHDFDKVPEDLAGRMRAMVRRPGEIPKAAVMPRDTAGLLDIFKAYEKLEGIDKILLGMGDIGFPIRILAGRLGSLLTFVSPWGQEAAPGHIDPKSLEEIYGYSRLDKETALYGILGNPVMHTKSPLIHNGGYRKLGLNATYIPFQIDDPASFLPWAASFGFRGFSVTVPHKGRVIPLLAEVDPAVEKIGSCNTLVRRESGWAGYNTDVGGFLNPLKTLKGQEGLQGMRAAVIGAGGAARAVVFGLVEAGADVTIFNRTLAKARELAESFGCAFGELSEGKNIEKADIIVQTTVIGMAPHYPGDPVAAYRFSGEEMAYDLIYSPPETGFMKRALASGCHTLGGMEMLKAQGAEQFLLFTGKELPV